MINHIKARRKEQGLTLQNVADAVDMAKSRIWELEQQRDISPKLSTAYLISNVLLCSVYDLWPDATETVEETITIKRVKIKD